MAKKSSKKIFVLDTNVILHDSECINQFEENDVVVPITVIEELDNFKKGNESVNYHARAFVRKLDTLSGDLIFNEGVPIGKHKGSISIKLEQTFSDELALSFSASRADHQILNIAHQLEKEHPSEVILVTKDVNLRMKAKAVGLMAQDYKNDHVKDLSVLYKGNRIIEHVDENAVNDLYQKDEGTAADKLPLNTPLYDNEYLIVRNGSHSGLGRYNNITKSVHRVEKVNAYGITPRNAEQTFALNALLDDNIKLATVSGKAGTGKTLLALAAAIECRKSFQQIFLARPVVPLSNKDIGYLPGDIQSKLNPYMQPLFDNLGVIKNQFDPTDKRYMRIKSMQDEEKLLISPLSYIRGRSLVKIYFIVDEAQNLTPHEIKTIITRAGEGTKMIFTGDIFQIDHPYLDSQSNGLSYLIEKMQGQHLYAHVNLEHGERSELAEIASDLL